jgi:hypothetical protein
MTPTLGDFLTLAGQHLTEAARHHDDLPAAAQADVIIELDRLLTVLAKYAREGLQDPATDPAPPIPSLPELTRSGVGVLIEQAAENLTEAASALPGDPAAHAKHPMVRRIAAAADCLTVGRDLIRSHHVSDPGGATSQLWPPVMNSAPVRIALTRELAGYSLQIARLTAKLAQPDPAADMPAATRYAVCAATGWLAFSGSFLAAEAAQPRTDPGQIVLYAIDANLPPPRHRPADQATVTELRAGVIATANRLRHLALRQTGRRDLPASSAAISWRHNTLAAAIISHTSELMLRTLTDRAAALGLPADHLDQLGQSSEALREACQCWRAVTYAWDPVTTGPSRRLSSIAIELDDLVLWTGRLAHTSTWTPARSDTSPKRPAADLAPDIVDVTAVLTAVSRCIDATATITRTDMHHMQAAAAASQIYSPTRHQPENRDRVHIYRYRPATPDQITNLLTTYDQAATATKQATAALDNLLTSPDLPADSHSLARSIGHTPARPQYRQHALPPVQRPRSATSRPEVSGLESLLHDLKISDPELLLRATALDHAATALAAEAITKAIDRTIATQEAVQSGYPYSRNPGPSARLAGQDTSGITIASVTTTTTVPVQRGRLKTDTADSKGLRRFPPAQR